MTTLGGFSDDSDAAPDPPAPAPRVDGRAPVLDGRPPTLRPPTAPARPARPVVPTPPSDEGAPVEDAPVHTPVEDVSVEGVRPGRRTRRSAIAAAAEAPARTRGRAGEPPAGATATLAAPTPASAPAPSAPAAEPAAETMADRARGRSLAQPPLPPHPGLGPTRRRLTVPPPSPPFAEADIPFHWQARLPSAIGRTVTIQVGDGKLDLGGTVVAIDQIRDARFKLQVEAALFRRAASARMMVALALKDGSTVRVSARNAASARRAAHIVETLTYLWTLLSDTAGAEERQTFVEKIDRGAEVQVGRLRLTGIGIAWKRNPIARWGTIGEPRRVGLDVVIPVTDGEPIVVPLTADDAYQLPILIPLLRQRFR